MKITESQYICLTDVDEINIFFRILMDSMQEKGVGIVQISQAAAAAVLNAVNSYSNGSGQYLTKQICFLHQDGDKGKYSGHFRKQRFPGVESGHWVMRG